MEECPICLNKRANLLTNCSHNFCETCLRSWVVNHVAKCPLCVQEIHAIKGSTAGHYLSPHFGRFGLTLQQKGRQMSILTFRKGTIAETELKASFQSGDLVAINGFTDFDDGVRIMRRALREKRMIFVSRHVNDVKSSASVDSCLCPFWRVAPKLRTLHDVEEDVANEIEAERHGT